MKKSVYLLGFMTFFTLGIGTMFEFYHWPFSGKVLAIGFLLFNFGFLPTLFYKLYKAEKILK
ncbi:hypothetical protein [uncultured Lacinutrix sp.]|uniref:hypothetical protein n=1 Tax=uncultured Lacinutrix sp. TaxID=574032 RepID=UPI0026087519|nr:hypothetical protein [uncultured Lacinutrix sp.]